MKIDQSYKGKRRTSEPKESINKVAFTEIQERQDINFEQGCDIEDEMVETETEFIQRTN